MDTVNALRDASKTRLSFGQRPCMFPKTRSVPTFMRKLSPQLHPCTTIHQRSRREQDIDHPAGRIWALTTVWSRYRPEATV